MTPLDDQNDDDQPAVDNSKEAADDATSGLVDTGSAPEAPKPVAPEEAPEQPKQTWNDLLAKAKKPTWDQFLSNAREQQTFKDAAIKELPDPMRWLYGQSPIGRVSAAFGQAYQEAGTEALNQDFLSPEIQKTLQDNGTFKNYMNENDIINKGWMDGTIVPASKTFMSAMDTASIQYVINPIRALTSLANAEMQGSFEAIKAGGIQAAKEAFGTGGIDVAGTHINPEDIVGGAAEYLTQSADPLIAGAYHLDAQFGVNHPLAKPMPVAAAKLIADGAIDEGVWTGEKEPTPYQQHHMQEAAKQLPPDIYEASTPHEGTFINPDTDIHTIARSVDPEAFAQRDQLLREHEETKAQYDALREARDADLETQSPFAQDIQDTQDKLATANARKSKIYQERLDDLISKHNDWMDDARSVETPEMEALKNQLQDNFEKRVDLARTGRVQAAYQEAEKRLPAQTTFEEPEFEKTPIKEPVPETGEIQTADIKSRIAALETEMKRKESADDFYFTNGDRDKDAAELKALNDRLKESAKPAKPLEEQRAAIVADATKQLTDIGRPLENAQAEAEVVADAYMTRAAKWEGRKGTGEELYKTNFPIVRAAIERSPNKAREVAQRFTGRELEQPLFEDEIKEGEKQEKENPGLLDRIKSFFTGDRELEQQARGKIRLGQGNVRSVITLFKNANASTFMHEMGHHFLDQLQKDAADPDAPESIKKDWKIVSDWLGHEGGDIKTRAHEKFARGFERYLMEGVAPSPRLAKVFYQFKQWLTGIYQTVKRLKSPINNDIMGVFDRMLSINPEKTVYAPEAEPGKMMADIHEEDVKNLMPENAPDVRDRIRGEIDRTAVQHEPEVHDAVKDAELGKLPEAVGISKPSGGARKTGGIPEQQPGKTGAPEEPHPVTEGGTGSGTNGHGIQPANPRSFVFARVPREPLSLAAYVKKLGGIKDVGGDILHTIGEKKQFPGLIKDDGRALDDITEKAWLDGYFPEKGENRPSINEFLDKLETDIKGAKQYSEKDAGKLKDYQDAVRHNEDIQRIADDLGITTFKSSKEFWDEVADKTSQQERDRLAHELTEHLNLSYQDMVDAERDYQDSLGNREAEPEQEPRTEEELENEREQERLAAEAQTRGENHQGQRATGTQGQGADRVRQSGGDTDADRQGPNDPYRPSSDLVDKAGNIRLENLSDNESFRQAMKDAAEQNPELFNHKVIPDREVADMCRAMGVEENAENIQKLRGMTVNDGIPLAVRIKAGRQALIDQCKVAMDAMEKAKSGTAQDLLAFAEARNKFLMIAETVSSITNEWGRAGRAFRDISKEEMQTADRMKDLFQGMTGQTDDKIREMAQEGAILENPAQAAKFMQDSKKPDFWDKIIWYRINCLISGPFTHMRYGIGNFIRQYLYDPFIVTGFQAAIGSAKELTGMENQDRVYWGEIGAKFFALTKGSADGLRAAATAWKENKSPPLPGEKAFIHTGFQPTSTVGKVIGAPGRSVGSIHSFFKQVGYEQNIQALAYRQAMKEGLTGSARDGRIAQLTADPTPEMMDAALGKDSAEVIARQIAEKENAKDIDARVEELKANPTPEMREATIQANIIKEATQKALSQVYMTPTDRDTALGKLNAAVNSNPLMKIMIPFMKIGTLIESQAILEGTPLGLLHPKIRDDLMYKNGAAKGDEAWGKIAAGTALMGTTAYLYSQGKITGDGPQDPAKRAIWLMTHKPHSIEIGGMWFSYQGLGFLGVQMKVIANMCEAAQETNGEAIDKQAAVFMQSMVKSVLDDNWMKGVKDTLDAVFNPQEYGEKWANDFATSWMPFSVGLQQTARVVDPSLRQAHGLSESVQNKLPFVSEGLYPKRDAFGEPIPSNGSVDRYKNDPVAQRLNALGKGIGPLGKTIMGQQLTGQQYDDYSRLAGRLLKQRLDNLIGSKGFDQTPPGQQIKEIQKQITAARSNARSAVIQMYPSIATKSQAEKEQFYRTGVKLRN